MFRNPMRLEKWIAFDGAAVADVVQAADADADADDANSHVDPFASENDADAGSDAHDDDPLPSAFGAMPMAPANSSVIGDVGSGQEFDLDYPNESTSERPLEGVGVDLDNDNDNSGIPAEDLYFEVTAPDDGSFSLWAANDKDGFSSKYTLNPGWYAFDNGDNTFSTAYWNGSWNDTYGGQTGGSGQIAYSDSGAVRFHVTDKGTFSWGQGTINAVMRSLVYSRDDGAAVDSNDPSHKYSFDINVFHKDNSGSGSDGADAFHGKDGGAYNPNNQDVQAFDKNSALNPSHPDYDHTHDPYENQGTWNNELTIPDNPTPPIINPPIPDPNGGNGEAGDDPGDDAGDGDAGGDTGYIVQREEMRDDDSDYVTAEDDGAAETVNVELEQTDDGAVESADSALAAILLREAEAILESVRGDRDVLLQSLSALQLEYLREDLQLEGPVRSFLRELFEWGEREKLATSRIIDEMHRQLATLAALTPAQRDGMLLESLRELIGSAERRSGEMGALSQGLEAVVRLLAGWSERGQIPDETEARAVFEASHEAALAEWAARAERLDPIGRELTAAVQ